jgi:nitrite reductase (NADH) large subunit
MAVGIRPNTTLAESAGIHCNRGIVVNDTMQTYDPKIYAVGECVSPPRHRLRPGRAALRAGQGGANHLGNYRHRPLQGSVTSTKLKVTGIDLFSAGDFTGGKDSEEIVLNDRRAACTRSWSSRTTRWSAPCCTATRPTAPGTSSCCKRRPGHPRDSRPPDVRPEPSRRRRPQGPEQGAAMADSAEVCGCNGVCKGTIVKAIKENGLFTLDDVRKHTKAHPVPAAPAPAWSSRSSATIGGAYTPAGGRTEGGLRLHRLLASGGARRDPSSSRC